MTDHVTVASIIDQSPLGSYRIRIVAVCFLIALMDGFDTQAIGFAAPAISSSLHIPITAFGQVFSAGLLGAMLGALSLGPLADRFGRRWVLAGSVLGFSLISLLTPHAPDLFWLLLCRFFTGLGLGGAIPNLLALSSEYTPRRNRGLLTGLLYAGFPLGGAIGALTSAQILPLLGWPFLFYIGGTIPLLLAAVVAWAFPEPLQFLVRQPDGQRKVSEIVRQIVPDAPTDGTFYVDCEQRPDRLPLRHLFTGGRGAPTLLLWIAFSMCFMLLIALVLWTPALLRQAGVDASQATLIVLLVNLGSVAGTALGGRLVDYFDPWIVLLLLFSIGAVGVSSLGYAIGSLTLLGLFAALSGASLGAASSALLGVAVLIYPSMMRATGVGWAMALGRTGQAIGPLVIGALLAGGVAPNRIFLLWAVPALFAAAAAMLLRWSGLGTAPAADGGLSPNYPDDLRPVACKTTNGGPL
ncbi:MFS transporter [Bradyrhizobium sp. Ai1a-2]|uniref:MFS transporter n=1 Tax=Bradyrhizobium sp. Ai1a-2 TaxID=196490 RepID=UPI0004295F1C|nr:MFS transporter [Bradyrhizobium sp. Ai1a-2]